MDDATTFAALAALPARFQWRTERRSAFAPLPDFDPRAVRECLSSTSWEIMITLDNYGFTLHGEGATLSAAYADARAKLVAYQELL